MQLAAGCATKQQAVLVQKAAMTAAAAMFRKSRLAQLHCLIAAADAAVTAEDFESAKTLLTQAQALSSRRDVNQPRLEAYGAYVLARIAAISISTTGSSADLDAAMTKMNSFALNRRNRNRLIISMPRIYQFELIKASVGKSLGGQTSDELLARYCEEPEASVWRRDPVDAISSLMADQLAAYLARVNSHRSVQTEMVFWLVWTIC